MRWAQRTRFAIESARREIGDIGQGLSGQVKLGIVLTAAQFLLPPTARDLLKEVPGMTVRTTAAQWRHRPPRWYRRSERAGIHHPLVGREPDVWIGSRWCATSAAASLRGEG